MKDGLVEGDRESVFDPHPLFVSVCALRENQAKQCCCIVILIIIFIMRELETCRWRSDNKHCVMQLSHVDLCSEQDKSLKFPSLELSSVCFARKTQL